MRSAYLGPEVGGYLEPQRYLVIRLVISVTVTSVIVFMVMIATQMVQVLKQ